MPTATDDDMDYLTPNDIAAQLEVTRLTVMRWVKDGKIAAIRVGYVTRIKRADFKAFLQRHHVAAITHKDVQ